MLKYVVAFLALFIVIGSIYILGPENLFSNNSTVNKTSVNETNVTRLAYPLNWTEGKIHIRYACIVDTDCGLDGPTDYFCWRGFIVLDHINYTCLKPATPNATCYVSAKREYIDWCRENEMCVYGKNICQPKISCEDGIMNQNESGIDCGGPCKPCPSCHDGIQNGDELGIDCGGICGDCEPYCESNESCGIPRWSRPYCLFGDDGVEHVFADYLTFECRNPGKPTSFCKNYRIRRLVDYCGPTNPCVNGLCYDDEDSPYNYKHGGHYGNRMPSLVDQYKCEPGQACSSDSRIIRTCIGDNCYDIKVPNN